MKLLAVVAHPDDAALFCGGTLAKHAERGDEVQVVYMTRGEYGGTGDRTESELAELRSREARRAGEVLGVSTGFLEFRDGRVEDSLENRREIDELLRRERPDLILTHHRHDDHPDHRATGRLVTDATYRAALPMVESDHDPVDPDNVYYFGKPSVLSDPDHIVDVTGYLDRKQEALQCHESQVEFLEQHGGLDRDFDQLIEQVRAEARVRGGLVGVRFAEGFTSLHAEAVDYLGRE